MGLIGVPHFMVTDTFAQAFVQVLPHLEARLRCREQGQSGDRP